MLSDVSLGLTVDGTRRLDFAEGAVKRMDQLRGDSVQNGVVIGVGSGAVLGLLVTRGAPGGTIGYAFWGGVAGWITDALIRKRQMVYLAPGQP